MTRKFAFPALLLCILATGTSWGQKHPQIRYIAFDAGINMAGISSSPEYQRHAGFLGASFRFTGNYSFDDAKSISTSLTFEQKGAPEFIHKINTNLNYLTVPVLYKFSTTGKYPRFHFNAGAYGAYLMNAQRRGALYNGDQQSRVSENITSEFRSLDYGILLGAGMMLRLYDDIDFMINIHGAMGIPMIKEISGSSPRNFNINISMGYVYYIGFR
ncbi:MAG: PorT family protein [Marinilabiliales bacterium]|nr:MAG: PorT family protein [Marinilabiliales bacterium]